MTSQQLLDALADRHAKDLFVPECKMGESWGGGSRRLDAWAMPRSWSPLTFIGYEIKTSRSDFLQDRKWEVYLPVVHEFYFVVPAKLVDPKELPDNVGLLWSHGSRLVAKRKAVRAKPDAKALVSLMSYVLMSRCHSITDNMWGVGKPTDKREQWAKWLVEEDGKHWLGSMVSRRLAERVAAAERLASNAEQERRALDTVRAWLDGIGLIGQFPDVETLRHHFSKTQPNLARIAGAARLILTEIERQ